MQALCLHQLSQCLVPGVYLYRLHLGWEHVDSPFSPGQPHSLQDFVQGSEPSGLCGFGHSPHAWALQPFPCGHGPCLSGPGSQSLPGRGGEPAVWGNPSALIEPSS